MVDLTLLLGAILSGAAFQTMQGISRATNAMPGRSRPEKLN